ncbi:enoyl-CoA hydratase/isomerase family protein [Alsobacter sp. KACC 23698]|uniref:Enoyl-CoA hydratase/isomerase family protein n=1 Tax=Alsobacter sp. KACC 23698 TaxID=3149229 RepID=A0AAU7JIM9_9HYPH
MTDSAVAASQGSARQDTDELLYEARDGIARITFNRPEARNALTFAMYEKLAAICEAVNHDPSIRVMVITGAGDKAFAAGTDISQFRAFSTPEDALGYEARIDRVLGTIDRCRVPVIAAIVGACTGGGAGIAARCDIRIGSANARFGFPIARTLGNCLSIANLARLSQLIGPARVKDMIFTARLVEAEEAQRIGLLSEVLDTPEAARRRADELATMMVGHAPLTMQATKEGLRRIAEHNAPAEGQDLILMCYMSQDFREGMEAFLNKRPPRFKGE